MEIRPLGRSGLRISALSFGAMTFGGEGLTRAVGDTTTPQAERLLAMCVDAGVNLFDTADVYSTGRSEEILGQALGANRPRVHIATKCFGRTDTGANDVGASRFNIIRACENSLRRLGTDYIDIYQLHNFDQLTPLEETLRALDDLVHAGKVRYIGASNYTGWQLMKALGLSDHLGLERYVSQQIYYSLAGRDAEWELVPLSQDQDVGIIVWGPLASGLLSGKFRRDMAAPEGTRAAIMGGPGPIDQDRLFAIVDVLSDIAGDRGVPVAQVAINYILHKPAVSTILIGARDEAQLKLNLGAADWILSAEERARLDTVSDLPLPYPYWHHQKWGAERNPYFARKK